MNQHHIDHIKYGPRAPCGCQLGPGDEPIKCEFCKDEAATSDTPRFGVNQGV